MHITVRCTTRVSFDKIIRSFVESSISLFFGIPGSIGVSETLLSDKNIGIVYVCTRVKEIQ